MIQNRNKAGILIGILAIIYCLGWYIQSRLLISWDVSWLLQVSHRLLDGGQYGRDFFEINPPLILYLYAPVVILSKFLSAQSFILFRAYIFILATGSLFLSYQLLRKNIPSADRKILFLLLVMLGMAYLLLPLYELGQREHLLILGITPYVLLMGMRMRGEHCSSKFAYCIGVVAGVGFALKPFFLLTWLSLEVYAQLQTKRSLKIVRPETIALASVLLLYGLVILFFHKAYLIEVIPRVSQFYYQGIASPWFDRIVFAPAIFCFLSLIFFVATYTKNTQKVLSTLFAIVVVCQLGLYFAQGTLWYYHILPAFVYALLLLMLAILPMASWKDDTAYWISAGLGLLMLCFLWNKTSSLWTSLVLEPISFFSFLAMISLSCLYYTKQSFTAVMRDGAILVICLAICYWFAQITGGTSWYRWEFLLTILLFVLFLCLYSIRSEHKNFVVFVALTVLAFAFPGYYALKVFSSSLYFAKQEQTLISFLKTHAQNKPVYFFSTVSLTGFPAADYAHAKTFTRTAALGWLPAWINKGNHSTYSIEAKTYFTNMVLEDLQKAPPAWLFVDANRDKPYLQAAHFDYLEFFSENPKFKKLLSEYQYKTTLDGGVIYKLAVYERVNKSKA